MVSVAGWEKRDRSREILPSQAADQTFFLLLHLSARLGKRRAHLPAWHKLKCLYDEPEKTSSIRLYIFVSQLFTQTLRGVKSGPVHHTHIETQNSHSLTHNWLPNSVRYARLFVCVCALSMILVSPYRVLSFSLTILVVFVHMSLSHVNVLDCLSFSPKPTDQ